MLWKGSGGYVMHAGGAPINAHRKQGLRDRPFPPFSQRPIHCRAKIPSCCFASVRHGPRAIPHGGREKRTCKHTGKILRATQKAFRENKHRSHLSKIHFQHTKNLLTDEFARTWGWSIAVPLNIQPGCAPGRSAKGTSPPSTDRKSSHMTALSAIVQFDIVLLHAQFIMNYCCPFSPYKHSLIFSFCLSNRLRTNSKYFVFKVPLSYEGASSHSISSCFVNEYLVSISSKLRLLK